MVGGFSHPRNQSTTPIPAMRVGEDDLGSADGSLPIRRLDWLAAVFAVIVQLGFVGNLVAQTGSPDEQANILNTLAVSLNITLLVPLCLLHYRQLAPVIYGNKVVVALIMFIFLTTAWSIYPDVTFRRSVNYFSAILTAFYIAGRFDIDEIMKILSWGIAIPAVCSFLFVAAFPSDAIHRQATISEPQVTEIAGAWKGVFAHKNVLGHVMSVGVIVELYILTGTTNRVVWHALLLCGCFALVILSRSSTAILLASFYLAGASLFFLLQRAREYFGVGLAILMVFGAMIWAIYWTDPNSVFAFLGSDATLTGRTQLWELVRHLISERPLLGWGYSAMWLPTDPVAIAVSRAVGWWVPQAHNAILEVTLELGFVGLVIVLIFIAVSLWRSVRCLMAGHHKLGMLSVVFFLGVIISGATESTFAQNQDIEWVVFNVLSFACGLQIMRQQVSKENPTLAIV